MSSVYVVCWIFLQTFHKRVREKSRECHNPKPQPFPDSKRKQTKPTKRKSIKRTKSITISSLLPKRGNRNFCIHANSLDPDQTAPRGAVWLGSTRFAKNKNHKHMTKQTTIVVIGNLRVKRVPVLPVTLFFFFFCVFFFFFFFVCLFGSFVVVVFLLLLFFSEKISPDISCESSARQMNHIKCQALLSLEYILNYNPSGHTTLKWRRINVDATCCVPAGMSPVAGLKLRTGKESKGVILVC